MTQIFKTMLAGREVTVETGTLAQQTNGSAFVSYGDTQILITACMSKEPKSNADFFPLSVNYEEKLYSVGKIPGGFLKREGKASEQATLHSRLIDRALRPLFDKGCRNDVQVIATVMSVDHDNAPEIAALFGCSLAVCISDIPFDGPVAAVNIGLVDGEFIVNPTSAQREVSRLDLTVAGTEDAVLMVEAGANEVDEETMIKAILFAQKELQPLIQLQKEVMAAVGKEKADIPYYRPLAEIEEKVFPVSYDKLKAVIVTDDKVLRNDLIDQARAEVKEMFGEEYPDNIMDIDEVFTKALKKLIRNMITFENVRPDGRKITEIRKITCEAGRLKRAHGSAVFTRGQTQVLSAVTLGQLREEQILDGVGEEESKRYIHHYNFPPYSTGETGALRSPGRREIGHGALAERALLPVIPSPEEFPYTIRVVSEVLSSNGSTSQASVCGSTLSLMDAGVPIKAAVAGIAMGLIKEEDSVVVLSDIQGLEDFYGDMDFKVAGTSRGITAIQMDIKIHGIDEEILTQALHQAREGRMFIMGKMLETLPEPREEMSPYAPRVISMQIPVDKIREVIGTGGKVINQIIADTGVKIDITDDGMVYIMSVDMAGAEKAKGIIEDIIRDIEIGDVYTGKITRILPIGAFMELPGNKEGLIHISKIAHERVEVVEDYLKVGDITTAKVIDIKQGKYDLSRKALLPMPEGMSEEKKRNNNNRNNNKNNNRNNNKNQKNEVKAEVTEVTEE